jgi:hypothetical protein
MMVWIDRVRISYHLSRANKLLDYADELVGESLLHNDKRESQRLVDKSVVYLARARAQRQRAFDLLGVV